MSINQLKDNNLEYIILALVPKIPLKVQLIRLFMYCLRLQNLKCLIDSLHIQTHLFGAHGVRCC